MIKGQVVNAKLYGGRTETRRVIADKGSVVVICSEAEYQAAEGEGREPSGIGFPREDIDQLEQTKVVDSLAVVRGRICRAFDKE